ncbi:MAG: hypothetical protein R2806_04965 [Saprospiraceae bacterium]
MHRILTLFVAILFSTWILAQPADSTYRTPGSHTFTIPTGYTATLEVSVWGGGGSGGAQTGGGKGGGGGAAFAMSTVILLGRYLQCDGRSRWYGWYGRRHIQF